MNIGFVSTWFERGAAYVTRTYLDALCDENNIFVFARGGECTHPIGKKWNEPYVTRAYRLGGFKISFKQISKWIEDNNIDLVFFNEQREYDVVAQMRLEFPDVILGAYVDYYTLTTIGKFKLYDFLICNTRRHYSVFNWHPQCFYLTWGVDTGLYRPHARCNNITFFHSAGMSIRKGTDIVLKVFCEEHNLNRKSKLFIHTQLPIKTFTDHSIEELADKNVTVFEGTVGAPGLYHRGDVYVYPTTLDGLGLTMYEALACGMPVITTDEAPMNEVIGSDRGTLVTVEKKVSRQDGYYWPLALVDSASLRLAMLKYVHNPQLIDVQSRAARECALNNFNILSKRMDIKRIFLDARKIEVDSGYAASIVRSYKKRRRKDLVRSVMSYLPYQIQNAIRSRVQGN